MVSKELEAIFNKNLRIANKDVVEHVLERKIRIFDCESELLEFHSKHCNGEFKEEEGWTRAIGDVILVYCNTCGITYYKAICDIKKGDYIINSELAHKDMELNK